MCSRGRMCSASCRRGRARAFAISLPAAIAEGLTIVVSPLISLMEDQVQQLRDEGIAGGVAQQLAERRRCSAQAMAELQRGFDGLALRRPERFFAADFQRADAAAAGRSSSPSTRPIASANGGTIFGRNIRGWAKCGRSSARRRCIALTATATDDVRDDIIRQLGLREPTIVVTGFDRPNLVVSNRRRIAKVVGEGSRADLDCCGRSRAAASSIAPRAKPWMR